MASIEDEGEAQLLPQKEASMNEENYVSYDESIYDNPLDPLDEAGRDYRGTILAEPKEDARLRLNDQPRKLEIDDRKSARHGKDGVELWGSGLAVTADIDFNLYRSENFRLQALLPTDKRPTDRNIYCIRPSGEVYAVFSFLGWRRNRRLGQLKFLAEHQASVDMYLDGDAVTEGLVRYFGTQWGKYLRDDGDGESIPCGWPDADKLKKLGISGHAFKRNNGYIRFPKPPDIPIDGMPKNALEFHRSWMKLDNERFRIVLWVYFVPNATEKEKAEALELTRHGYRFLVEDAISAVIRHMLAREVTSA